MNLTIKLNESILAYWKSNGFTKNALKQYSLDVLEELFRFLSNHYYNDDELVSDSEFDVLYRYIKTNYPNSVVLQKEVRAAVRTDIVKVPLFAWMSSLDKAYDEKDLSKFLKRHKDVQYTVSDKMDGFSLELSYDAYGNSKLVTGGDGKEGQDVSHLIPFLNLPKVSETVVRCEGIISKADFESLKETLKTKSDREWKNARNMLSNVFNSKHPYMEIVEKIKIFALEVVYPSDYNPSLGFHMLDMMGFTTPNYKNYYESELSVDTLKLMLSERKRLTEFDIDGLVLIADQSYERVKKDNPKYAIAFKENTVDNVFLVPVVNVHDNVSRTGRIIPQIEIEPTEMQGVTVTFATGHNYGQIRDRGIGKGSVISVTRSGDVIPYVIDVIQSTESQLPRGIEDKDWYWATDLDIAVIHNDTHPLGDTFRMQRIKELSYFASKLGIDGIKEGTATKLYDAGIITYEQLIKVKPDNLKNIDGIGESTIANICDNIAGIMSSITLPQFAAATNSFGNSIGQTKLETLNEAVNDLTIINFMDISARVRLISNIRGFSETSAHVIANGWDAMIELSKKCDVSFTEVIKEEAVSNKLDKMYVVFTGVRDKDTEDYIIANGGEHGSSMSKATVLIMKATGSGTSKEKKAIERGIEILTLEEFKLKYAM